ncbi:MAG: hypothetical protein K0R18_376 [Bacillales bacterium]|jgi:hypothetical protein|nr:hypothetical protein [Bacillales bacterium]
MDSYVCHCNLEAFDGVSNLKSKPTEYVEAATDEFDANRQAKEQLKTKYEARGCSSVQVVVVLTRKAS